MKFVEFELNFVNMSVRGSGSEEDVLLLAGYVIPRGTLTYKTSDGKEYSLETQRDVIERDRQLHPEYYHLHSRQPVSD